MAFVSAAEDRYRLVQKDRPFVGREEELQQRMSRGDNMQEGHLLQGARQVQGLEFRVQSSAFSVNILKFWVPR